MFDLEDFENKIIEEIRELESYINEKEKKDDDFIFSDNFFETLKEIEFLKKVIKKI